MSNGAGSRGGKIIRYTKGGNPVYDPTQHTDKPSEIKRIGKAAGYAASSVAASGGLGEVAGRIARKSANVENKAFDLAKLAKRGVNAARQAKVAKFAVSHSIAASVLQKAHGSLRVAAAAAGGALLFKAATSAIEGTSYDVPKNKIAAAAVAAGGASAVTRIFENRHLATSLTQSVVTAIKKIRKPIRG